jgi:hypothetical protein
LWELALTLPKRGRFTVRLTVALSGGQSGSVLVATAVIVADTTPSRTDCVTHAHVLAVVDQDCIVENYDTGSPKGVLALHGGVAQDKWGPVGVGYALNRRLVVLTGYRRSFHYDPRFLEMMPPGYDLILNRAGTCYRIAWRDLANG